MMGLDCAAATRASTQRSDTESGRQTRIARRAARYLSCSTRYQSERIGFAVAERETGRHPDADRSVRRSGTARSIASCQWPVPNRRSAPLIRKMPASSEANAARLKACNATQDALISLSPAIALPLCISHEFTIAANAGHLEHRARTSVRPALAER